MMSGPTKPFDPFGSRAALPRSDSKAYSTNANADANAKLQGESSAQATAFEAAAPANSTSSSSSPTTTATATTAASTSSTSFISPAGAALTNGQPLRHTSIFELGGEPFGDQATAGSGAPSSRLSRIVGAANGGSLSSTTSPIGLHPLGTIGSPHSFFNDAYTPSQTPSGAASNASVGPPSSSSGKIQAPAKRLSQSRFSSVLSDAAPHPSGVGRSGDKAVGAGASGGASSGVVDPKQSMFDSVQSQQASPNTSAQAGFSDFFVKSLPVSRRNSREFQNLWQELEGFSINDNPAQPVNISNGIPAHLSGYDGHSIAARNSSGAFRNDPGASGLGASPKLPHGLLDDDVLSVRPTPAGDVLGSDGVARVSGPPNSGTLANGAPRGTGSKIPNINSSIVDRSAAGLYDVLQPGASHAGSGTGSGGSAFAVGRANYPGYPRDPRVANVGSGGAPTVTAALDSMGPQKNPATDMMLGDAARDMRLYDPGRGVNLIRNASTPVLNTKQYQVLQSVDELSLLQSQARGGPPSAGFADPGNVSMYDVPALAYGSQHHGHPPPMGVGDLGYALAGSRLQSGAVNYPYVVNPSNLMAARAQPQQQQPFIAGPTSGSATPMAGVYGLSTPLGPGMAYGMGPQPAQLSVPHTPLQHAHHAASHIHIQPQQQPQPQPPQAQQQQPSQPAQPQAQPQAHGTHQHPKHQHNKPHRKGEAEANRFANTSLEDLKSTIFSVCKDQHGCRFLQKKLEDGQESHVNLIFEEVSPHFAVLMTDPFGNYLCQKLLEHCTEPQRTQIVTSVAPELVNISLNMHGTRAVQKMIEYLSNQEQIDAIIRALRSSVVMLIRDLNGNHVIQKCLNRLTSKNNQFIYNAVADSCVEVATHRHGCCVFQRCIDYASNEQKYQLVKEVIGNALTLVQDPFGNYVVQYVLDLGNTEYSEPLIKNFVDHICGLSVQKFSSNVMEKCIRLASPTTRKLLVAPLLQREKLDTLMRDSYGNYVVQTALDFADSQQRVDIIEAILPLLPTIRHTPYGKRIYIKLQRDGFVSAVPSAAGSRHASPTLGPSIGSHSATAIANMPLYPVSVGPAGVQPGGSMAAIGSALSRGVSPTISSNQPQTMVQGRVYMPSGGSAAALDQAGLNSYQQAVSFQQLPQQQQQQQQGVHSGAMYLYKMANHEAVGHPQVYQATTAATHHVLAPAHPGSIVSNGIYDRPAMTSSGSSTASVSSAPSASDASKLQASYYGAR